MAAREIPRMLRHHFYLRQASNSHRGQYVELCPQIGCFDHVCIALGDLLDKTVELAATDYDLKKQYDFKRIKIQKEYG